MAYYFIGAASLFFLYSIIISCCPPGKGELYGYISLGIFSLLFILSSYIVFIGFTTDYLRSENCNSLSTISTIYVYFTMAFIGIFLILICCGICTNANQTV